MGETQAERPSRRMPRVHTSEIRSFALLAIASVLNPELSVDADTAAAILRTTPGNVRRLRKRGVLPGEPATGRAGYVFPLAAVLALRPHLRPKSRRLRPFAPGGANTINPEAPPAGGNEGELPC